MDPRYQIYFYTQKKVMPISAKYAFKAMIIMALNKYVIT